MNDGLVTLFGGGGFIGRYAVQALVRSGMRVRIVQRHPRAAYALRSLGDVGQVQVVAGDITRPDTLRAALTGADAAVNLVGILSGKFTAVHVKGSANIAQAAAAAGVSRFVQVSALGADRRSPSRYGRTKAAGEAAVREHLPQATVLRPSIVFGREDQFINRFARMIVGSPVPVVPVLRRKAKFQPVFVGDLARAIALSLTEAATHGGKTYAIGGPQVIAMGDLIRWIIAQTGRKVAVAEIPYPVGALISAMGFLPGAPITWDQWRMLGVDNVVPADDPGITAFGISPVPLDVVAPPWLVQYRQQGRFASREKR